MIDPSEVLASSSHCPVLGIVTLNFCYEDAEISEPFCDVAIENNVNAYVNETGPVGGEDHFNNATLQDSTYGFCQYINWDAKDLEVFSQEHHSEWKGILEDHKSNVETRWKMLDLGSGLLSFAYYGVSVYFSPLGIVPLLAFKSLRSFSEDVDAFCRENDLVFGYSVCDVLEVSLSGYSAYSVSAAIKGLSLGLGTTGRLFVSLGGTVVGKTVSQALIKDNQILPSPARYNQNFVYQMGVEFIEAGVDALVPGGGWFVRKPLSVGIGQVMKELVKHGVDKFEPNEVRTDTIKTLTCSLVFKLLPEEYSTGFKFQFDFYCKNAVSAVTEKVINE